MRTAEKLYKLYSRNGQSQRQTCKKIADDLDINHKYFYQIMTGKKQPSAKLTARIINLYRDVSGKKPPAYKPRLVISYDSKEKQERHMRLGNSVRKKAFDHFIKMPAKDKYYAGLYNHDQYTPVTIWFDNQNIALESLKNANNSQRIAIVLHGLMTIRGLATNEPTE